MRVLLLTCDQPNQWALAHRMAQHADLAAIVFSENRTARSAESKTVSRIRRLVRGLAGFPFRQAWFGLQKTYRDEFGGPPDVETIRVPEVNDPEVARFVERIRPDLVLVSGTNLLRGPLIEAATSCSRLGVVNLHTGLSPYLRGGPNCTNWCLALSRPWLVGNTVMWIDQGIDSGDLITTECTPLNGSEGLKDLHRKVMDHAHDLVLRAMTAINGGEQRRHPQADFEEPGDLYLTRDWTPLRSFLALCHHRLGYRRAFVNGTVKRERAGLNTIDLVP